MRSRFLAYVPFAAAFALASQANAAPHPVCSTPAASPTPAPVVTPETSRAAASRTAGLIADRVATVVSNTTGARGQTFNAACPTVAEQVDVASDPMLGAGASTASSATSAPARANSVWTAGSYTRVDKADRGGEYDGSVVNAVVGYDRRVTDRLIAGVATGYEKVDIETHYNNGTVEGDSVTVAPYLGYALTDWLSVDLSLGRTWIGYDFTRNYGGVTGSTDAARWFGAANLTATQRFGDFRAIGGLGYLRLYEDQDSYRESDGTSVPESDINFGQARATVGGAYDIATGFGRVSPNAFARLEYDLPQARSVSLGNGLISTNDRTGMVFGLGLDLAVGDDLTVNLSGSTTQFRENTDAASVAATVRYRF